MAGNFLTGSPSTSGNDLAGSLKPYLTGLLNQGPETWTVKKPGGKGGCGAALQPFGNVALGGASAGLSTFGQGGSIGSNFGDLQNTMGGINTGGNTGGGGQSMPKSFNDWLKTLAAGSYTKGKGGAYTFNFDPTKDLPGNYKVTDNPNRSQSLGAFALDPNQITAESKALSQYSDPSFLDVANNPYVKNLITSLENESNTNLQKQLGGLGSTFGLAGQTNLGGSSPFAQASTEQVGSTQQSLSDTIAQQLFQQFTTQEQLQQTGLQEESQFNMLPANIIAQLGPLLNKSKGATPSPLNAIGQIISAIGGLAGGATGLAGAAGA